METFGQSRALGGVPLGCTSGMITPARTEGSGSEVISTLGYELEKTDQYKPYSNPNSRPHYAPGQVEQVWENAKQMDGKVYDPNTGEELFWDTSSPRNGQWDMGHIRGEEYHKLWERYMNGDIDYETFLKNYRDPSMYRPEASGSNRGRTWELR